MTDLLNLLGTRGVSTEQVCVLLRDYSMPNHGNDGTLALIMVV